MFTKRFVAFSTIYLLLSLIGFGAPGKKRSFVGLMTCQEAKRLCASRFGRHSRIIGVYFEMHLHEEWRLFL